MLAPTDLLGTWSLRRRVVDRRTGQYGRVEGTLTLEAGADGVNWHEHGRFRFDGREYDASRSLVIRPSDAGWTVCFADGHEFHPWRPGVVVSHLCRADVYRGLIVATPTSLRFVWDVSGPAKSQRLVTRCVRSSPSR